jgi:hypothetical protein
MGRRSDYGAVLLTVQVYPSEEKGVVFFQAGEFIFLADYIPPDCFSGPPLPKETPEPQRTGKSKKETTEIAAGSFFLDLDKKPPPGMPGRGQKKKSKKNKQRRERPPWRR